MNQLKSAGRLGADVEWTSLDLTRFGSTAKLSDDAHRAVSQIAAELQTDAPHLFQVLTLAPPGGTPLLATAFAFFLRRQIATNPELAIELTHDGHPPQGQTDVPIPQHWISSLFLIGQVILHTNPNARRAGELTLLIRPASWAVDKD